MANKRRKQARKKASPAPLFLVIILILGAALYYIDPSFLQDLELFPEQPSTLAPPSSSVVNPDGQEVEELSSRNQALAGKVHEKTGVPYERVVTMGPNGHYIAIVVPQFDYFFSVTLPQDLFLASDSKQFAYANSQLKSAVEKSVDLQKKFSADQLAQIRAGKRPKGYTWHHDAPLGLLLLVDSDLHAKSAHTGEDRFGVAVATIAKFFI